MIRLQKHFGGEDTYLYRDMFHNGCQTKKLGDRLPNGKYANFERVCDKYEVAPQFRRSVYHALAYPRIVDICSLDTAPLQFVAAATDDTRILKELLRSCNALAVQYAVRNPHTRIDDVIAFARNRDPNSLAFIAAEFGAFTEEQIRSMWSDNVPNLEFNPRTPWYLLEPMMPQRDFLLSHPNVPPEYLVSSARAMADRTDALRTIADNPNCPPALLSELVDYNIELCNAAIVRNRNTPADTLLDIANRNGLSWLSWRLADNPNFPIQELTRLLPHIPKYKCVEVVNRMRMRDDCDTDTLRFIADTTTRHSTLVYARCADTEFLEWLGTRYPSVASLAEHMIEYKKECFHDTPEKTL